MAEHERETKKQRREKARAERRRKEEREAQRRRQQALRNGLITMGVVALVGLLVFQAFFVGDDGLDEAILISSDEISQAEQAAGCETLVERDPLPDSSHFDRAQAPPGDLIYPEVRPTHSGPHTAEVVPAITGGSPSQLDEYTSTHNLEHGAVIVWYDPDRIDEDTADEMGAWAQTLNDSGFHQQGGAVIFVSPYEEPGIASGKAIALRAWGTAVDCDEWDETVGNGFVAEHFGTRGIGPEAAFAPYPDGVLEISDRDIEDRAPEDAEPDDPHEAEEADLDEVTGDDATDDEVTDDEVTDEADGDEPDADDEE